MPGFDEAAVLDADDGDPGDGSVLAGGLVDRIDGPAEADEIVFGKSDAGGDTDVPELGLQAVIEGGELLWSADRSVAFVKNAIGSEEFEDDVAAGLVPNLVKPAAGKLFVVFKDRSGRGGHGNQR